MSRVIPFHVPEGFKPGAKVKSALAINDGGSIILNASIASIRGFPAFSVYNATKAAVRSFARTWTNDLRQRRIRVNAITRSDSACGFFSWKANLQVVPKSSGTCNSWEDNLHFQ